MKNKEKYRQAHNKQAYSFLNCLWSIDILKSKNGSRSGWTKIWIRIRALSNANGSGSATLLTSRKVSPPRV